MRKIPILKIGMIFLLSGLAFVSEAGNLKNDIVGKWQASDGSIIEYLDDGTVILGNGSEVNYSFLSDGRLKLEFNSPSGRMVKIFDATVSGNDLIMNGIQYPCPKDMELH